jgi:hypothetical protein
MGHLPFALWRLGFPAVLAYGHRGGEPMHGGAACLTRLIW